MSRGCFSRDAFRTVYPLFWPLPLKNKINWKEGLKMGFVIGILVVVALVFGIVYLVQRT
jgi:hypothetical protein